ncbi:MAG: hypothetical protein WAX04_08560 [Oscillospiraceae bacterium]
MFMNKEQSNLRDDGKTNEQHIEEKQENYISQRKHELFDQLEPKQVKSNARFNLGGMAGAGLMFIFVLGVIVGGLYLFDFLRGAL